MKWIARLGRHLFTDYDNATWELGAFFIALSLSALIVFQAISIALGGHFNALEFGGAVSAILVGHAALMSWAALTDALARSSSAVRWASSG